MFGTRLLNSVAVVGLGLALAGCQPELPKKLPVKTPRTEILTVSDAEIQHAMPEVNEQQWTDGQTLLLACQSAYLKLKRLSAEIHLENEIDFRTNVLKQTIEGSLRYAAPNDIEITFSTVSAPSSGLTYLIRCDANGMWVSTGDVEGRLQRRNDIASTLFEFAGVSLHLSTILPAIVLGTEFSAEMFSLPNGKLLTAFASGAYLDGEVEFDGHRCDRVICPRKIGTWTFLIDKSSHLLHSVREDISPAQMAMHRTLGGGGTSGTITHSQTVQTFRILGME